MSKLLTGFLKFYLNFTLCNPLDEFVGKKNPIVVTPVLGGFPPEFSFNSIPIFLLQYVRAVLQKLKPNSWFSS